MKSITRIIAIFMVTSLLTISCKESPKTCILKGKIVGFECQSILLLKAGEDLRFEGLEIPVKDSIFEYELTFTHAEGYNLFLGEAKQRGGGRPMPLILEPGEINITLFPENEFDKNIVEGGKFNAEFKKFNDELKQKYHSQLKLISDSMGVLFNNGNYYSDTMKVLNAQLRNAQSQDEKLIIYKQRSRLENAGIDLSDSGKRLKARGDKITEAIINCQMDYIDNNPTIVSYYLLFEMIAYRQNKINLEKAHNSYKKLAEIHSGHPYNEHLGNVLNSAINIKVGGKYIDFVAPDMNGNNVRLSDSIKGKIALIDLWATWCGPCIATSRTMIPIYEEFKDSDFTIIAVAGEFRNTERLQKTLNKEKFPWINLVELDKQSKIWDKYGCSNSGGSTFLVDKDGSILAVNPSAEEVKEILNEKLM